MTKIYSHTLVKNGKPFIIPVLKNVLPFVDKMLITVSEQSTDGTKRAILKLAETEKKIIVDFENVDKPELLTHIRQKQLDQTPDNAWVLFLDDDDWWPEISLQQMIRFLTEDVDGFANNPIQLAGIVTEDLDWRKRYFTKWFKKTPEVHYKGPWPKDLIYKGEEMLYWRKNLRVSRVEPRYFHLSHIKPNSFRKLSGFEKYDLPIGQLGRIPDSFIKEAARIYGLKRD